MLNDLFARARSVPARAWLMVSLLVAGLLWVYWPALRMISERWSAAQYSHGWLVPFFSLFILWQRRRHLAAVEWRPNWWGFVFLGVAIFLRLTDGFFYVRWLENLSLLPSLAGLCLLLGGWPALRWAGPSIAFLFFMLPLPYMVETAWAYQLRVIATTTSTFALQTFGLPAIADGTDIWINDQVLQIAPACSGIGMLLIFFALSSAFVLATQRPWLDKLLILLSAIPIAVVANIVRITLTALLYELSDHWDNPWLHEKARALFHDGAGYLMMIVAIVLLLIEIKILDRLIIPVEAKPKMTLDFTGRRKFRNPSPTQKT